MRNFWNLAKGDRARISYKRILACAVALKRARFLTEQVRFSQTGCQEQTSVETCHVPMISSLNATDKKSSNKVDKNNDKTKKWKLA